MSQKESSLYPVLKRLLEAGLLETYDQEYQEETGDTTGLQRKAEDGLCSTGKSGTSLKLQRREILVGGEQDEQE